MKTALYERHEALGAKIVDFAGWKMPLYYTGILHEHLAVRSNIGIFDVSHMGRIEVQGHEAESLLDYLSTNKIKEKSPLSATYTVWTTESGGCLDDLIVYKQDPTHFFVVVNASNRQKDLLHLKKYASAFDVQIHEKYSEEGILAIQGPKSLAVTERIFPEVKGLKPMQFLDSRYNGNSLILSATGYTGAGGIEIYAPHATIVELWDRFLEEGKPEGLIPVGLGARDTLRLEMGYALYGHEIHESIFPSESVSRWTICWKKKDFLGKEILQKMEKDPKRRSEYGIVLIDQGVAREGYEVYHENRLIGKVTSGAFSPSLNQCIALILIEGTLKVGDRIEVQIRQNKVRGEIVSLPFLKVTGS